MTKTIIQLLALGLLIGCLGLGIMAHTPHYLLEGDEGSNLARKFQDVALTLTKDVMSDRRGALDLYWNAYDLGGRSGTSEELQRIVGALYPKLVGGHVARLILRSKSSEVVLPSEPLILTQGKTYGDLLLIVENQTSKPQSLEITGSDPDLEVTKATLSVVSSAATGIYLQLTSSRVGQFHTSLNISFEGRSASLPLEYQVRRTGRLQVRVFDPEGQTVPSRVYATGADGFSHTPESSMDRVIWVSGEHYFRAEGQFELLLPEGKARVEVVKGFDYLPASGEIEVKADAISRLDLRLRRLVGMNAKGWYSGDEHIHGNYFGAQFITPADDLLILKAEDLNVGNLLVSNSTGAEVHDERYFEGRPHALSTQSYALTWNQELRTYDLYGHLIFGNLRELVRPLYTGFPGTPNWEDYPSNYVLSMKAKDQGGYTSYAHPAVGFGVPMGSSAGESVVDVALGSIDALEVFCDHNEPSMALWYRFLNCGFKLSIASGSDAFNNHRYASVPGGERSYVYTGGDFSAKQWFEGLGKGRTFATTGPLLFFEVEDKLSGEEFQRSGPTTKVKVHARAISYVPMHKLEIVANGVALKTVQKDSPTELLEYEGTIELNESSWIGARVWGPAHRLLTDVPSRWAERRSPYVLLAHSAVSYVYLDRQPIFSESDRDFFLDWLDKRVADVRNRGKFATEERRQEVIDTFMRARRIYERLGT